VGFRRIKSSAILSAMQKRAIRFTVLGLLLIAGAGAGLIAWNVSSQLNALDARRGDMAGRLDRLLTTIADIGAAQHAYVAPGQSAPAAFEQVASLIQRIHTDVQAVQPTLESVEAAELLTIITDSAATLVEADGSARSHYHTGQTLWAAEVIFGQARDTLATMTQAVRALQAAEARTQAAAQAQLQQSLVTIVGGGALLWTLGLLALTWVPRRSEHVASQETGTRPAADTRLTTTTEKIQAAPSPEPATRPAVDLTAAASVCTGISRLNASSALPGLLARAAQVIDASGIIIWMGAGDELFAAAGHGYDPRIIARLGSISRSADNATATAWRTGEPGTVASDTVSNGAIVAPMFGAEGCIGVLAAEVRQGREADTATRAVTTMLAAQLATVVTAWPAASAAPAAAPAAPEAPQLREASGL
jgi:hypothetical protein